jgi:2-oxoglutarate ferredoxin oxidoreductase subunit delta
MAKPKGYITIKEDRCKGCNLCVVYCPENILYLDHTINVKGYHPVAVTDMELCTGCGVCVMVCPDLVLEAFKKQPQAAGAK